MPNRKAVATGFNSGFGVANSTTYSTTKNYINTERELGRILSRSVGARKSRRIITATLLGGLAQNQAMSHTRIAAQQGAGNTLVNSGVRTIETVTDLTGLVTASDRNNIVEAMSKTSRIGSYPVNKGGYAPGKIGSLV